MKPQLCFCCPFFLRERPRNRLAVVSKPGIKLYQLPVREWSTVRYQKVSSGKLGWLHYLNTIRSSCSVIYVGIQEIRDAILNRKLRGLGRDGFAS